MIVEEVQGHTFTIQRFKEVVKSVKVKLEDSDAWGYGGTGLVKNTASPAYIDLEELGIPRVLWLPGTAGNYVSTPDVNEIDYDSSTFENGIGKWEGLNKNLLTANQSSVETDASGWSGSGSTVARTTAQALEGTASLSVTRTGTVGAAHAYLASRPVVVPGQVYTALASVRAATTARAAFLVVIWFDAAGSSIAGQATSPDTANHSSGWTQLRITAQAPSNAVTARVDVQHKDCAAGEVHYVDAVGLFETPNGNLVPNPDFENGTTGWTTVGTSAPTLSASTARSYAGRQSMALAFPGAGTEIAGGAISPDVIGVNGQTYTASVYVYVPTGAPHVQLRLDQKGITPLGNVSSTVRDQWQRLVLTGTMPASGAAVIAYNIYNTGTEAGTIYADAVQVVVGSAALEYLPPTTHNLLANPSMEGGVDSTGGTYDTAQKYLGTRSFRGERATAGQVPVLTFFAPGFTQAGLSITVSAYVYTTALMTLSIDADGQNGRSVNVVQPGSWQRISVATSASAATNAIRVYSDTNTSQLGTFYVDAVQLEHGSVATPYVDGSLGAGYSWDASENLLDAGAQDVNNWSQLQGGATKTDVAGSGARIAQSSANSQTTRVNFGAVPIGTILTASIKATNNGATAAQVNIEISDFASDGNGVVTVPAGGTVRITNTQPMPDYAGMFFLDIEQPADSDFTWSEPQLEQRSYATPYAQTGTAHASTSTRKQPWVLGGTSLESVSSLADSWVGHGQRFLAFISTIRLSRYKNLLPHQFGYGLLASVAPSTTYTWSFLIAPETGMTASVIDRGDAALLARTRPDYTPTATAPHTVSFTTGPATTQVRLQLTMDPNSDFEGFGNFYMDSHQLEKGSAATPYTLPVRITGDIDLRAHVALEDWTPGTAQTLVAKWAAERSYLLSMNTGGTLRLLTSSDGSYQAGREAASTVAVATTDGARKWVRVTRVASTGTISFYTSDDGVTWTTLGVPVIDTAGAIHANLERLEVGSNDAGVGNNFKGKLLSAEVRAGIDGTVVARYDAAQHTATTYTDAQGKVWTISRSGDATAEIVDRNTWAFTGTEWLTMPDRDALEANSDGFAVAATVLTRSTVGYTRLVTKRTSGSTDFYSLTSNNGFEAFDATTHASQPPAGTAHDGVWHTMAAAIDRAGGAMRSYRDGSPGTTITPPAPFVNASNLHVGAWVYGGTVNAGLRGLISWVALFRRVLTEAEHAELAAWDGSVSSEPIWLRDEATLYVNIDDVQQKIRYKKYNRVINLAAPLPIPV